MLLHFNFDAFIRLLFFKDTKTHRATNQNISATYYTELTYLIHSEMTALWGWWVF